MKETIKEILVSVCMGSLFTVAALYSFICPPDSLYWVGREASATGFIYRTFHSDQTRQLVRDFATKAQRDTFDRTAGTSDTSDLPFLFLEDPSGGNEYVEVFYTDRIPPSYDFTTSKTVFEVVIDPWNPRKGLIVGKGIELSDYRPWSGNTKLWVWQSISAVFALFFFSTPLLTRWAARRKI